MLALAQLGDSNGSFALAERLYPSRGAKTRRDEERIWLDSPDSNDVAFLTSKAASQMRRDRRFLMVAERVGLLDYWRSGRLPDFCTKAHEPVCAAITKNE